MFDPAMQQLLDSAVNTPFKLHLLLIFHDNPRLEVTSRQLAERMCRDIWSTAQALDELASAGMLAVVPGDTEPSYRYDPAPDMLSALDALARACDHPLERERVHRHIHDLVSMGTQQRPGLVFEIAMA